MATDWAAAVAKMRALVQVYLDVLAKGALSPHQAASLATDLKTLDTDLAGLHAQLVAAPVYTADEIWAKFLDAEDAVLKAAGKPYGRDGAERGSVTRDEAIALVNGLGIPNALEILASAGYNFGPEPPAGTIA